MKRAEEPFPSEWLELGVQAEPERVEAIAEVLGHYGYQGGVVIEESYRPAPDGLGLERDPSGPVLVRTYLPHNAAGEQGLRDIQSALDRLGQPFPPQVRILAAQDWAHFWKVHFDVLRVGRRFVIVPAWRDFEPQPGDLVITLDPGLAFGTGLHPTTQLCLKGLERYVQPGGSVLDLGTGSGILAIAAARLGGGSVLSLDNDPLAVIAARENVELNQVESQVQVEQGTLEAGRGRFELILANILAPTIQELAPLLAASLPTGGILIASGIFEEQAEAVCHTLDQHGLRLLETLTQDGWVALVFC
ncbi:MAG: 50S ribosomal protein L11 methyltransferase [Chloroflexia bacterium]|nr:50S ribosomal protein L11 methyltransferase [Chloroflexia bacterium]